MAEIKESIHLNLNSVSSNAVSSSNSVSGSRTSASGNSPRTSIDLKGGRQSPVEKAGRQSPDTPGRHKRTPSLFDRLFSSSGPYQMNKKVSLSPKIEATLIVGDDLMGGESLSYVRLHSRKELDSIITTRKVWSPPNAVIFYSDKPDAKPDSSNHIDSPVFPISIDITESNIKFPKKVFDNVNNKPKMYFVVQTGGNGQSLHCEQALFNNKEVNKVFETQASSMSTPCKEFCSVEIFSLNPKIKCEHATMTSLDPAELERKDDQELKVVEETMFCCYFGPAIRTDSSPIKISGLNPEKTEHFISKITTRNGETILTFHWITPPAEFNIINQNICNPLLEKQFNLSLSTLLKQFEFFKQQEIDKVGKYKIPSFLDEPLETLKCYLEFKPVKNVMIEPKHSRSKSQSSPVINSSPRLSTPPRRLSSDSESGDVDNVEAQKGSLSTVLSPSMLPQTAFETTFKMDSTRKFSDLAERATLHSPQQMYMGIPNQAQNNGICLSPNRPPIPLHARKPTASDFRGDFRNDLPKTPVATVEKSKSPQQPMIMFSIEKPKTPQKLENQSIAEKPNMPQKQERRLTIEIPKTPQNIEPQKNTESQQKMELKQKTELQQKTEPQQKMESKLFVEQPKTSQKQEPRLSVTRPKSPQRLAPRISIDLKKPSQNPIPGMSVATNKLTQPTRPKSPHIPAPKRPAPKRPK